MSQREQSYTYSRRQVLTAVGTSSVGLVAGSGVVAAQENGSGNESGAGSQSEADRIAIPAIMPETGMISADENYTGFLLKLTARLEGTGVEGIGDCTVGGWSPSNPRVFETQVVDTVSANNSDSYEVIPSSAYLPQDTDFQAGDLFVINSQSRCGGGYLGITLENIRAAENAVSYNYTRDEGGNGSGDGGGSGALGPGFGPVAAVGGVLGGAYALARRGRDED